jgi:hypothetical protein
MANVKYGSIVTDMKGKVGGQTFKGTKAGGVLQNNATPVKGAKLTKADAGRAINPYVNMAAVSSSWRALSDSQRSDWNGAAPSFPFKNKFGVLYTASGYQLYVSCNLNSFILGGPQITVPPDPTELVPCPTWTFGDMTAGGFSVLAVDATDVAYKYAVYATPSYSKGRAFEIGRSKLICIMTAAQFEAEFTIETFYKNIFGPAAAGQKIWVLIEPIRIVDGRAAEGIVNSVALG